MKNLLIVAIIGGLGYFGYQQLNQDNYAAVNSDGSAATLIFVFDGCGAPCNDGVGLLKEKGVDFELVNLSDGPEAVARLDALGGGRQLPVLFVGSKRVDSFHRQRFNEALAEVHGLSALDYADREILEAHFNADGSPAIVMYGASWCPYCKEARDYFTAKSIPFTEWDVEQNPTGKRYWERIKANGYPLIYVGYRRFEGFDKAGIHEALDSHTKG